MDEPRVGDDIRIDGHVTATMAVQGPARGPASNGALQRMVLASVVLHDTGAELVVGVVMTTEDALTLRATLDQFITELDSDADDELRQICSGDDGGD